MEQRIRQELNRFLISITIESKALLRLCPKLRRKNLTKNWIFSVYPLKTGSMILEFNWSRCVHKQLLGIFQGIFCIFVRYCAGGNQRSNFFAQCPGIIAIVRWNPIRLKHPSTPLSHPRPGRGRFVVRLSKQFVNSASKQVS